MSQNARDSPPVDTAFCVGAVAVSEQGEVLSTGYSRELPGNRHAEEVCLKKLSDAEVLKIHTMYTTMEPCGERNSGRKPCAIRLLEAGIVKRVVVGVREPGNVFVTRCIGEELLTARGVKVEYLGDTNPKLAEECLEPNRSVLSSKLK
ncbi:cytidine deaminase-like protein [Obelidium mucronatum]|nr:cytidine deaminase-like protein [Obelidium mucronatum]